MEAYEIYCLEYRVSGLLSGGHRIPVSKAEPSCPGAGRSFPGDDMGPVSLSPCDGGAGNPYSV